METGKKRRDQWLCIWYDGRDRTKIQHRQRWWWKSRQEPAVFASTARRLTFVWLPFYWSDIDVCYSIIVNVDVIVWWWWKSRQEPGERGRIQLFIRKWQTDESKCQHQWWSQLDEVVDLIHHILCILYLLHVSSDTQEGERNTTSSLVTLKILTIAWRSAYASLPMDVWKVFAGEYSVLNIELIPTRLQRSSQRNINVIPDHHLLTNEGGHRSIPHNMAPGNYFSEYTRQILHRQHLRYCHIYCGFSQMLGQRRWSWFRSMESLVNQPKKQSECSSDSSTLA